MALVRLVVPNRTAMASIKQMANRKEIRLMVLSPPFVRGAPHCARMLLRGILVLTALADKLHSKRL